MDQGKLKILSQGKWGFVSIHEERDLVHLCFKNILLNFAVRDFLAFRDMVRSLVAEDCWILFPDRSRRVMLRTPYHGINFSFIEQELQELLGMLDEAYYMQELHIILNKR